MDYNHRLSIILSHGQSITATGNGATAGPGTGIIPILARGGRRESRAGKIATLSPEQLLS